MATEAFFTTPAQLRARLPELYEELRKFYRQDPATLEGAPPAAQADSEGARLSP